MKKIFYSLTALMLGVTLTQCAKMENEQRNTNMEFNLTVRGALNEVASEEGTRVSHRNDNGHYTVWDNGDHISVAIVHEGVQNGGVWTNYSVTDIQPDGTASFTGVAQAHTWGESHTFYAKAPHNAVGVNSIQNPGVNQFDAKSVILTSLGYEMVLEQPAEGEMDKTLEEALQFTHMTGFLHLQVGTLPSEVAATEKVKSVTITAGQNDIIAGGRVDFDPATGEFTLNKTYGANTNKIYLDYSALDVTVGDLSNIWAVALPGAYASVDILVATEGHNITYAGRTGLVISANTVQGASLNFKAGDSCVAVTPVKTVTITRALMNNPATGSSGTGTFDGVDIEWRNIKQGMTFGVWANGFGASNASDNYIKNTVHAGARIVKVIVETLAGSSVGSAYIAFSTNGTTYGTPVKADALSKAEIPAPADGKNYEYFRFTTDQTSNYFTSITIEYEEGDEDLTGDDPGDDPITGETESTTITAPLLGLVNTGNSSSAEVDGINWEWTNYALNATTQCLFARNASNYIKNTVPVGMRIVKVVVTCDQTRTSGGFDGRGDATVEFGTSSDTFVAAASDTADGTSYVEEFIPPAGDYQYMKFSSANTSANYESITVVYEPVVQEESSQTVVTAPLLGLVAAGSSSNTTVDGIGWEWANYAIQNTTQCLYARNTSNYIKNTTPAGSRIIKVVVTCDQTRTSGGFDGRGDSTIEFGTTSDTFVAAASDTADGTSYVEEFMPPAGDYQYFKFTSANTSANYESITVVYE
jgi:hypothetical protein